MKRAALTLDANLNDPTEKLVAFTRSVAAERRTRCCSTMFDFEAQRGGMRRAVFEFDEDLEGLEQ